jgi:predicted nuclease of predicted toxin-antitoxin system
MRILLDMNLSPTWERFLQAEGFEVAHWASVGDPRAPDSVVMAWAAEHEFVVFTHDLDFGVLLALTSARAPSVVQVRTAAPVPEVVGRDVVRVLRLREDVLRAGALLTIEHAKARVRTLPFAGRTSDAEEPE